MDRPSVFLKCARSRKDFASWLFDLNDVNYFILETTNTTPWAEMDQTQLSRKLEQLGSDIDLLNTKQVDRVIGLEPSRCQRRVG